MPEALVPGTPAPIPDATAMLELQRAALEKKLRVGGDWFFWIAGLSLVNTALTVAGSSRQFVFGLAIMQVIDYIAREAAGSGRMIAFTFDVLIAGMFILFGLKAREKRQGLFILGMVLYALDGVLGLLAQDWIVVGVHAFALFCLWSGFSALSKLTALPAVPGLSAVKTD